ncbi:MAG: VacJ family lipoprotein [Desulfuromonadales bacterium]|nr:VacJ family lipoprotein [Desulfuromonadales bacterium]
MLTTCLNRWLLLAVLLCGPSLTDALAATTDGAPATEPAPATDWTDWSDEFEDDEEELAVADPLQTFNRGMFWVNDKLYFYLFKPVARGYRFVVPEPGRRAVGRVFTNLSAPVRIVNSGLQGKFATSLEHTERFLINSTLGIGGLFDMYANVDEKPAVEDFGQTLGHYGIGNGAYLVLPVFGPTTLRDGLGRLVDRLVDPIPSPYYLKLHDHEAWTASAAERINWLSLDRDTYEAIKEQALDPYLFIRNGYLQRRAAAVAR